MSRGNERRPIAGDDADRRATSEFAGRVEEVDMMREFELTMPGAQTVSEHLPVWAEFSVYESGQPGRVGTAER
jgi:deoxyribonuclease-1-like protein